jgi:solute carrier family 25 (mitochondrial phosphate transporter), member 23/24/25/41
MMATMVKMYKTEGGISGLYRGIIPTVAGVAPYVRHPRSLLAMKSL